MLKKNKGHLALTTCITALPMLIGLMLWDCLPDMMPTHFDINGVADGWSSKSFAVFALPTFIVAIHLLCTVATLADPRKENIQEKIFRLVLWICPVISIITCGMMYSYALGMEINTTRIVTAMMGVLFIIIGNYLPKCKQNYTVGIKLPWTFADADNWERTHRLAGWLWVVCGIVILFTPFLGFIGVVLMLASFAIMILVPVIYSYLHYRKYRKEP